MYLVPVVLVSFAVVRLGFRDPIVTLVLLFVPPLLFSLVHVSTVLLEIDNIRGSEWGDI
jgi:hypothetical protein